MTVAVTNLPRASMLYLDRLFFPTVRDMLPAAYVGSYNVWLVALSVLIAVLAAFVALSIAARRQHGRRHLVDAFHRHALVSHANDGVV